MKTTVPWRLLALAAVLGSGAAGCVSLSKYNALKSKESTTVQDLDAARVHIAALKKENKDLSSDLSAVRKKLAEFAARMKLDLLSAQKTLSTALELAEQNAVSTSTSASVFISTASSPAR
jgi:outer membrane murein-binding lipoprotein Lpp